MADNSPRRLYDWINWLITIPWKAARRMQAHYEYRFVKPGKFVFRGKEYVYLNHPYNLAYQCERAVEIPIVWSKFQGVEGKILEIGNTLSHYYQANHEIIDKYETGTEIINEDFMRFNPQARYDLIVSISTIEHIGFDEEPQDKTKTQEALKNIERLLSKKGCAIVTVPFPYNPELDDIIARKRIAGWDWGFLMKIGAREWVEVSIEKAKTAKFNYPFPHANCIAVGVFNNAEWGPKP